MPRKLTRTQRDELKELLKNKRNPLVTLADRFGVTSSYLSVLRQEALREPTRMIVRPDSESSYVGPVPHHEVPAPNVIPGITREQLMSGRAKPSRRIIATAR